MAGGSWTHLIARAFIRPMVGTPITPNHLTTGRLITGLAACAAFAVGSPTWTIWGGVLWLISAFLDRADGELARLAGSSSKWGHVYDYICDVVVNSVFFLSIGIGLRDSDLGWWAVAMGLLAGSSVLAASVLSEALEKRQGGTRKAYEGFAGFDFDDILYLFAPIAWLGWLSPLLIGAAIGGPVFATVTWYRLIRAGRPADL